MISEKTSSPPGISNGITNFQSPGPWITAQRSFFGSKQKNVQVKLDRTEDTSRKRLLRGLPNMGQYSTASAESTILRRRSAAARKTKITGTTAPKGRCNRTANSHPSRRATHSETQCSPAKDTGIQQAVVLRGPAASPRISDLPARSPLFD